MCPTLGDPRVVPCFRWPFCLGMSPSETPGRSSAAYTQSFADDTGLRPLRKVSALPTPPHSASRGGSISGLTYGSLIATTCRVARPPDGADRVLRPADGDFYIRASGGWSPAPPPDITTVATGQFPLAGLPPARTPTSLAATAHRTGQAHLAHPALGERFTVSPTESCLSE